MDGGDLSKSRFGDNPRIYKANSLLEMIYHTTEVVIEYIFYLNIYWTI